MSTLDYYTSGSGKVTAGHRERLAFVYVRQSTHYQVEHHRESRRRQYDLHKMALDLGWTQQKVVVIDEDQGKSGSCPGARNGFGRIVTGGQKFIAIVTDELHRFAIFKGAGPVFLAFTNSEFPAIFDTFQ